MCSDSTSGRQFEWLLFYGFTNATTADALSAHPQRFGTTAGCLAFDTLQIRTELSAGDSSNFGTDAAEVFCFTASFNSVTHLSFFAAYFAFTCHFGHLSFEKCILIRQYLAGI
jgi:hypothetical protein